MKARAFGALLGALLLFGGSGLAGADGRGRGHGGGHHGGYKSWQGGHGHGHYRGHDYGYYKGYRGPGFSFWFGPGYWSAPFWYGAYGYAVYPYPYPYAYPPPYGRGATVIVGESPVYVERPPAATPAPPAPPAEAWWHWCESRGAYYPQAESCPEGWVKVPPRAP